MKISRLFEIVYLLLNKKTMTAAELAEHFEVSKRTILRDIDTLSSAGIPIFTSQGKGGGISILDNFVLNKTAVSEDEQNQILLALQSLSATQYAKGAELLSKLGALFGKSDADWIEVDFSRWGHSAPDNERFELLKQAILGQRAVAFSYAASYGESTIRTVYPLKLLFKSKAWYLQAFCLIRNDYRAFRISRMQSVTLRPDSFDRRDFAPSKVDSDEQIPPVLTRLVLQFASSAAYRVYDEFEPSDISWNEDGTMTMTVDLPCDNWLLGYLLSFGTDLRVLEPISVREALLAETEEIKNIYLFDKT